MKNMYWNSRICKGRQFSLKSNKTLWYHELVFKPEIKNIANNKQSFTIRKNAIKPANDTLFALKRTRFIGYAQMKI